MAGRPAILKVDIVADAKGVGPGVSQAEGKFNKLGSAAKKAGKIAALGLAAGLGLAAVAAGKMAKAAAEDEAAAAKLANTLKNAAGATDKNVAAAERWITKQGKALGVADDELRPALARLATATGDVGKAQQLAALAMDVSAGTGKSLEAVSTALMKAQNGQVSGLSRLGIQTKNAAGETLTMDQVTRKLADTYKGAASSAANTAAGQQKRLALRFSELQETIGAKLLPIISALVGWIVDKVLPAAEKLGNKLAKSLGPAFKTVGRFITETAVPAAKSIYSWFVEKIVPGIQRYVTPILAGLRSAFGKVAEAIERNRPQLEKLLTAVKKVAEFIAKYVMPVLGKLIGEGFKVLGKAIGAVIDTLGFFIDKIASAVELVKDLVGWIKNIDFPSPPAWLSKIPGLGSAGGLATGGGGHATGGGMGSWASFMRGGTSGFTATTVIVQAPVTLSVQSDGFTDEAALARKLEKLLRDNSRRTGRSVALAVGGVLT